MIPNEEGSSLEIVTLSHAAFASELYQHSLQRDYLLVSRSKLVRNENWTGYANEGPFLVLSVKMKFQSEHSLRILQTFQSLMV